MKSAHRTTLFLAALVFSVSAFANQLVGVVTEVHDGDTVKVEADDGIHVVRLAGIDAPEMEWKGRWAEQPYARYSQQALNLMLWRQNVTIEWKRLDRNGRIIGQIFINGNDVNAAMLANGFAWAYRQFFSNLPAKDRSRYAEAEESARRERKGLWQDSNPVPPWEWRKNAPQERDF